MASGRRGGGRDGRCLEGWTELAGWTVLAGWTELGWAWALGLGPGCWSWSGLVASCGTCRAKSGHGVQSQAIPNTN